MIVFKFLRQFFVLWIALLCGHLLIGAHFDAERIRGMEVRAVELKNESLGFEDQAAIARSKVRRLEADLRFSQALCKSADKDRDYWIDQERKQCLRANRSEYQLREVVAAPHRYATLISPSPAVLMAGRPYQQPGLLDEVELARQERLLRASPSRPRPESKTQPAPSRLHRFLCAIDPALVRAAMPQWLNFAVARAVLHHDLAVVVEHIHDWPLGRSGRPLPPRGPAPR